MDDLLIEGAPHTYHFAEKAVMLRLQEIVFEVTDCCNPNKGGETCDLEAGNYPFLEVWNAMGYNDELLSKDKRKSDGVVTVVNKNDTDGDGLEDLADPIVKSSINARKTEVDLIKLRLKKGNLDTELASNEKVTFMCNSDKVRFYLDPCKSIPIAPMTLDSKGWFTLDIPLDSIKQGSTIYVEAIAASTKAKDITIKLKQFDKEVDKPFSSSINVTALWVELKKAWYDNSTTPIPGQGELADLASTTFLADRINNTWISKSGQRYGFGSFLKADIINGTPHDVTPFVALGTDKQIGGRILFDFVIQPSDQESMKAIEIDCTRRKTNELFKIFDTDFKLNKLNQRSYTAPNEPELSNDDTNNDSDEVRFVTNGHIYCADLPASYIVDYEDIERSFKINVMNFQEYIRIRPSEIDKNNVFQGDAKVMGTRCTNLIDWHCIYYLKRGVGTNNAKWELDISPISVSSPRKEDGFMGEGEIDIKTSTSTLTSSYTLLYTSDKTWSITDLRNFETNEIQGVLLPNSTKMEWKKLFAGLEIRITSGDKPFAVGDTYHFSTYKASNKKNIIGLGSLSNNPRM